jgi:sugar-phosphate isomerase, RpiB/LacA/LacB family
MTVYIGSDHQGFELKEKIKKYLEKSNRKYFDVGNEVLDKDDDFTDYAKIACLKILADEDPKSKAILVCGGGQGMAMAANRFNGIRAAVIWDENEAKLARHDNDANVMALPAHILKDKDLKTKRIVDTFLDSRFSGAMRYKRRNNQLDEI